MADSSSTSLLTGIVVAAFGLLPLAVVLTGALESDQTEAPVVTTTVVDVPTTQVEVDPPEVEGLDPRLTRVLYANGSADGVEVGSTDELPESIVKVLGYYGVTLAVDMSGEQP